MRVTPFDIRAALDVCALAKNGCAIQHKEIEIAHRNLVLGIYQFSPRDVGHNARRHMIDAMMDFETMLS